MSNKNCCLPFILFIILSLVTILQLVGFIYLFDTLCSSVPVDREYCNETLNGNNTSSEQEFFTAYQVLTGISTAFEFFALCSVLSRVFCCVENVCVPWCHDCWEICFQCGNGWIALLVIGVIIGLAGQIVIGAGLPVGDVVPYIRGFPFNLSSLVLGAVTICGWFGYLCKYGCPPDGYFLGSDKVFSDYAVKTTIHKKRVQKTDQHGNVYWENEVTKTHRLVWKGNSNRVGPNTTSHM